MTQRPITLPERPDPYTVASTMKCVACGAPYEAARALAPNAARGPFAPAMSSHACKCGSNTFGGSVGYDSPSPAQFTAAQLDAYARAAVEADREASRSLLDLLREQETEIVALRVDAECWRRWTPWMEQLNKKPFDLAMEFRRRAALTPEGR